MNLPLRFSNSTDTRNRPLIHAQAPSEILGVAPCDSCSTFLFRFDVLEMQIFPGDIHGKW